MDKKIIKKYQIFSIIFTFILGTLLQFTYKIFNGNSIVSIFSTVNESTWEHLKLIYFPMLLTTIIGCFYIGKNVPNLLCAKAKGMIISMIFIVVFFYTYSGILGKNIAFIDISSFYFASILGEYIAYLLMINQAKCSNLKAIIFFIVMFILFTIFTYSAPHIGLFKDPITGQCGISENI